MFSPLKLVWNFNIFKQNNQDSDKFYILIEIGCKGFNL